jgi:hypothetical protein
MQGLKEKSVNAGPSLRDLRYDLYRDSTHLLCSNSHRRQGQVITIMDEKIRIQNNFNVRGALGALFLPRVSRC